jgi:hypothetical protein
MHLCRITAFVLGCLVTCAAATSAQVVQPDTASPPASRAGQHGAPALGAFLDSLNLLMIEHGTRLAFQEKTRRELAGPFWSDYRRSVRVPAHWEDTDPWLVNYVGHPIHGAAAGYLWLDHESDAPMEVSLDTRYWASRARALAWAAAYSLQFEIGPLSEASIGNVGMRPETTGWVDYVVTPVAGFGFIVTGDALDRYFVRLAERHVRNVAARAALRLLFTPGRTLANTASGHLPWYRKDRPIGWR